MASTPEVLHRPFAAQSRLEGLVERVLSSEADDPGRLEIPVPPSGAIYLNAMVRGRTTFSFSGETPVAAPKLYFGGQLVKAVPLARIDTPWTLVGLQFTATGFRRLFHEDASKLTDRVVSLAEVAPRMAEHLETALSESLATVEIARLMQDALVDHLPAPRPAGLADRATGIIDQRKGRIDISELADALAVTPRHLRRVFARDVGLSPKSYAKTVQLNEIVAVLHSGEEGAMHDLALAHGYYDQSHFVRDFTRRVGNNPGAFLSGRDLFLEMFLGRKSGD